MDTEDTVATLTPSEEAEKLAVTVERIKASHSAVILWVNDDNSGGYEVIGCLDHAAALLLEKGGVVLESIHDAQGRLNRPANPGRLN